jgi:CRP-like cAMP-binding protein
VLREQPLSNLEVSFLASLSTSRKIDGGDTIFSEGDAGDAMYVVLDGRVVISKFLTGAGIEALAVLGRGEIFGEMALIDRLPRSADAVAHEEGAVVLSVPAEVLHGLLDIEKFSSVRLLKILCGLIARRVRATDDKLFGWFMMTGGDLAEGSPKPSLW